MAQSSQEEFRSEVQATQNGRVTIPAPMRRAAGIAGLSLGDRGCLALATRLATPVYTADRAWAKRDIGVNVQLIRGAE